MNNKRPSTLIFYLVISLVLCSLLTKVSSAQNMAELRAQKEEIHEEISMLSGLINQTTESLSSKQAKYALLLKRREAREVLLKTINREIAHIQQKIETQNALIDSINGEISSIKAEYAYLARQAYRWHKTSSPYLYILSSESMNQAFRRYRYIKQFEQVRKKQKNNLVELAEKKRIQRIALKKTEEEKQHLRDKRKKEKQELQADINEMSATVETLKSRKEELKADLEEQKRQRKELDAVIAKVIARERKRREKEKKSDSENDTEIEASPEAVALAHEFTSNKGKLPWPVEKGIITRRFGQQPHPTLRNLTVDNNGIDITTKKRAEVHSIFNGKVIGTVYVPGYQKMVIVKHGDYYSVYSRLEEIYVDKGMDVEAGTVIGNVFYDEQSSNSRVHLEIWHGKDKLNPEVWLLSK